MLPARTLAIMARPTVPIPPASAPGALGLAAWRAFLHAHAAVSDQLGAELEAAHHLPLPWYDVLVQLAEVPARRLRMRELAAAVLLSRSGLTRLVDRLEREGLVRREQCVGDARGVETVLTEAGLSRLRQAAPTHLDGIARHVTGLLTAAELGVVADALGRIAAAGGRPVEQRVDGCGQGLA